MRPLLPIMSCTGHSRWSSAYLLEGSGSLGSDALRPGICALLPLIIHLLCSFNLTSSGTRPSSLSYLLPKMDCSVVTFLSSSFTPLQASAILTVLISLSVLVNVLFQFVAIGKGNKPPLVFHYFPIIGSTVSYGKDPMVFFERCKQKVRGYLSLYPEEGIYLLTTLSGVVRKCIHIHPPWTTRHCIPWSPRKQLCVKWKAKRTIRRRSLCAADDACFWD